MSDRSHRQGPPNQPPGTPTQSSVWHFRRCHICGATNQRQGVRVDCCEKCGRHFAPFFYFDESAAQIMTDRSLRPPRPLDGYEPIYGLVASWDEG